MSTCCLPENAETSLSNSRIHLYMHNANIYIVCRMLSGKDASEDEVPRHEECTRLSEELLKRLFLQVTGLTAILLELSQVSSFLCFIYSAFHVPSNAKMSKSSKTSIALVVCWLLSTIISNFLTYTSGSITGSVEVLVETSLQRSIGSRSTAFTIWDFYTLMSPGAKPSRTVSFTAAIDYPEITTSVIFPQVHQSSFRKSSRLRPWLLVLSLHLSRLFIL